MQIDFSALLIGLTIRASSIGSALWVYIGGSVLSILIQFLSESDHTTLWWRVVGVNWLILFHECRRAAFWARYCSFCTLQSFFPF